MYVCVLWCAPAHVHHTLAKKIAVAKRVESMVTMLLRTPSLRCTALATTAAFVLFQQAATFGSDTYKTQFDLTCVTFMSARGANATFVLMPAACDQENQVRRRIRAKSNASFDMLLLACRVLVCVL